MASIQGLFLESCQGKLSSVVKWTYFLCSPGSLLLQLTSAGSSNLPLWWWMDKELSRQCSQRYFVWPASAPFCSHISGHSFFTSLQPPCLPLVLGLDHVLLPPASGPSLAVLSAWNKSPTSPLHTPSSKLGSSGHLPWNCQPFQLLLW